MKKLFIGVLFLMTFSMVNAQEGKLNIGPQIGIPTGNIGNFYSFALGFDANYMFEVDDRFEVGPASALLFYFGKDNIDNIQFLPIAGAGRFKATDEFVLGLDMGYAIGFSNAGNGFYFKPQFGYQLNPKTLLYLGYTGLGDSGHFTVGASFGL